MKRRVLSPGFDVSPIGLGCMGMSEFYGPRDDETSLRVLAEAADLGIDLFDTSDTYGPHHNEELLGKFLAKTRAQVKVATKFGIVRINGEYKRRIDNSPSYVQKACEASLARLGVDRIDLYYVHRVETGRDIEEVMSSLAKLVADGKIDRVGLSEVSAETLRRAHAVHPVTAVQTEYSLWTRDVEDKILPACRELGIGFVPYSPLGRGFLAGTFQQDAQFADDDFRASLPRFQGAALDANRRIADAVARLAKEKGCTPAQLSIAWLLAKGDDIVPIPGTKRSKYLRDNAAAVDVQLTPGDVCDLERAMDALPVAGERYTEEGMKGVAA